MTYLDFTRDILIGMRYMASATPVTQHAAPISAPIQQLTNAYFLCKQRNLNNCFAYDLVPSVEVLTAALKAARRVNDFPTAVRVFEGTLPQHPIFEH
jgi:hypothetical protein